MNRLSSWIQGRTLVVRADASAAGGTGHAMRSLALAQAWLDLGGSVGWLAVTLPSGVRDRLAGEGIAIELVEPEAAGSRLTSLVRADPGARAVVDGPDISEADLLKLAPIRDRTLLVDDAAALAAYPVAFVLNQNAHADPEGYPPGSARLLLGPRYALLRREFVARPPRRSIPLRARHLLVTFGGADPTGMTARAMRALQSLPSDLVRRLEVRVIVGAANPDAEQLRALAAGFERPHVTVEERVTDMPSLMAWADLALSAGGSTIWELARMGTPTLVVETVPIEVRLVAGLARIGLFGHLGQASRLEETRLAEAMAEAADDAVWRGAMSARGRRLVDGRGARRVVEALSGGKA